MHIELSELRVIMPRSGGAAALYLDPLNESLAEFAIDNPDRQAAYLANAAVESRELTRVSENLTYTSASRIVEVFGKVRFPTVASAAPYVRQPEKLANYVYADRMGNGPVESGDGWRCRGLGVMQVTGRKNQEACAAHFGIPFDEVGTWMQTKEGACRSGAWFWWSRALNVLADQRAFTTIVRRITGAQSAIAERRSYLVRAQQVLG